MRSKNAASPPRNEEGLAQGAYFKSFNETLERLNCTSITIPHLIERLQTLQFEHQYSVTAQVAMQGKHQPKFRDSVQSRLQLLQNIARQLDRPLSSFGRLTFQPGGLADALDDLIDQLEEELTESKSEDMNRKNVDLCRNFFEGKCPKGVTCSFSHTKESMEREIQKWLDKRLRDPKTAATKEAGISLAVRELLGPEALALLIDACREREKSAHLPGFEGSPSPSPISTAVFRELNRQTIPVVAQVVAGNYLSYLRYLDLSKNYMCRDYPKSIILLSRAIERNLTIEGLGLGYNALGVAGSLAVLNAILASPSRRMKTLNLESNGICPQSNDSVTFMHFSEAVGHAAFMLDKLSLGGNDLGHEGCRRLCTGILEMESHRIPQDEGSPLSEETLGEIELPSLRFLDLGSCSLGDAGIDFLAEWLKKSVVGKSLKYLNISWNKCGSDGVGHLCSALAAPGGVPASQLAGITIPTHPQLKSLRMNYNVNVGRKGALLIGQMLKVNATLTHLDLRWNSLTDDGIATIFEGLQTNKTLRHVQLALGNGKVDPAFEERLKERMQGGQPLLDFQNETVW